MADCPRKKAADNRKRQEKDRRERQNQQEAQRADDQSAGKRRDRQSQDRVRERWEKATVQKHKTQFLMFPDGDCNQVRERQRTMSEQEGEQKRREAAGE